MCGDGGSRDLRFTVTDANALVFYSPSSVESENVDVFTLRPTGSSGNVSGMFSNVVVTPSTKVVYVFAKFPLVIDNKLPSLFTTVDIPAAEWHNCPVKIIHSDTIDSLKSPYSTDIVRQ
jgi:hypothetical protein